MRNKLTVRFSSLFLFVVLSISLLLITCSSDNITLEPLGRWLIVGYDGLLIISDDRGLSWTQGHPGHMDYIHCVATDTRGTWLHCRYYGTPSDFASKIYYSPNGGMDWLPSAFDMNNLLINDVESDCYGIYIIALGHDEDGMAAMYNSSNAGRAWTQVDNLGQYHELLDLATDNQGYWVSVGTEGTIIYSVKPNEQWYDAEIVKRYEGTEEFFKVTYVGRRMVNNEEQSVWIAVGFRFDVYKRVAFRSVDGGLTWHSIEVGSDNPGFYLKVIVSDGNGKCVYGGSYGVLYTTIDFGDHWTKVVHDDHDGLVCAGDYDGNGRWILVLSNRNILISDDLSTWTLTGPICSSIPTDIKFGEGE